MGPIPFLYALLALSGFGLLDACKHRDCARKQYALLQKQEQLRVEVLQVKSEIRFLKRTCTLKIPEIFLVLRNPEFPPRVNREDAPPAEIEYVEKKKPPCGALKRLRRIDALCSPGISCLSPCRPGGPLQCAPICRPGGPTPCYWPYPPCTPGGPVPCISPCRPGGPLQCYGLYPPCAAGQFTQCIPYCRPGGPQPCYWTYPACRPGVNCWSPLLRDDGAEVPERWGVYSENPTSAEVPERRAAYSEEPTTDSNPRTERPTIDYKPSVNTNAHHKETISLNFTSVKEYKFA